MNQNKDHPVIKTSREVIWPNWVPFFNLGWAWGRLTGFRDLVKDNAPWDFKRSVNFSSQYCPSSKTCKNTLTLCGICVDHDVPGNIHYGYIGRAAGIRRWFLLNRASAAQEGGIDPPHDVSAIIIGMDLWDKKDNNFCSILLENKKSINYGINNRAKLCQPCNEKFQ